MSTSTPNKPAGAWGNKTPAAVVLAAAPAVAPANGAGKAPANGAGKTPANGANKGPSSYKNNSSSAAGAAASGGGHGRGGGYAAAAAGGAARGGGGGGGRGGGHGHGHHHHHHHNNNNNNNNNIKKDGHAAGSPPATTTTTTPGGGAKGGAHAKPGGGRGGGRGAGGGRQAPAAPSRNRSGSMEKMAKAVTSPPAAVVNGGQQPATTPQQQQQQQQTPASNKKGSPQHRRHKPHTTNGNQQQQPQQNQQQHQNANQGGKGGKGKGGGNNNKENNNNQNKAPRIVTDLSQVTLLDKTGVGTTVAEQTVTRHAAHVFFQCRMQYLEPLTVRDWTPHEKCLWLAPSRMEQIEKEMKALWNYKPLQVNDETRWKPRRKREPDDAAAALAKELRLGEATAIMNKLSWTNLDRLMPKFVTFLTSADREMSQAAAEKAAATDGTTTTTTTPDAPPATTPAAGGTPANGTLNKELVQEVMELIVHKAMEEPHFAELYARFSHKLAGVHKVFKKTLLGICQEQFEATDQVPTLSADPAEQAFELTKARKKSIGLMQFIGELYKNKLIKGFIMISCLQRLLQPNDEEQLECFTKLMTTIGARLHQDEDKATVHQLWDQVYSMAGMSSAEYNTNPDGKGPKAPSTRIKFLLQDLIELKENDWVKRREEEKAKTIAQIHQEMAQEEAMRGSRSPAPRRASRSLSSGTTTVKNAGAPTSLSQQNLQQSAPKPDEDGFTTVLPGKPKKMPFRRAQSEVVLPLASVGSKDNSEQDGVRRNSEANLLLARSESPEAEPELSTPPEEPVPVHKPDLECMTPKECGDKAKNILKEFFIGGDTDEAVNGIEELVGMGEGSTERGTGVVEACVLTVMEMKEVEVRKFLKIMSVCVNDKVLNHVSIRQALRDPLEFLRDIEIDAPRAAELLAEIVAEWMRAGILSLDVLTDAPDYFRTDGRPVEFAAQVLAHRGGGMDYVTEAEMAVIASLMNDKEKAENASSRELLQKIMSSLPVPSSSS